MKYFLITLKISHFFSNKVNLRLCKLMLFSFQDLLQLLKLKIVMVLRYVKDVLTFIDPFISESCIKIKIKLNCYFHPSMWCLKRFYEGLKGFKGLHKTFRSTTKKCENENLIFSLRPGLGREGLTKLRFIMMKPMHCSLTIFQ